MNKKRVTIGAVLFWCVMAVSGAAWCGDNGNGTVTVNGLVWLKDAGCLGRLNWNWAMVRPKILAHGRCGLTDKSKIGDWRLPNLDELKRISSARSQFKNVPAGYYWSSSPSVTYKGYAYFVDVYNGGFVHDDHKDNSYYVWPVRAVK